MQSNQTNQLFAEGTRRTKISESRSYNFLAAKLIAELVKNSLGPRGLQKMFIDILGEVTITKDGATLLRKIDVEHPAAKALIDASNSVDNEVGDGTTSVVVFAGALLEKAEGLLKSGIPPSTIIDGYYEGMEISLETLQAIAQPLKNSDTKAMESLVNTCLKSKAIGSIEDNDDLVGVSISKAIIEAVCAVADLAKNQIEVDDIKIEEKIGNISDTELVRGVVIDKTIDSPSMPRKIRNARILLLDEDLDNKRTKTDAQIYISSPSQIRLFKEQEQHSVIKKVQRIISSGANVVISRKGISPLAMSYLAREGIISVRRIKENDLLWLEKATGATAQRDLDMISKESLGFASTVCERSVADDKMVFVEGCRDPKSVTLLLRAGSKSSLDECHRSVLDAIAVLKDFIIRPAVVGGGGSPESIIAGRVMERSVSVEGKEQLVIQKFAEALEEIPLTLARNAGMNVVDALTHLRARNNSKGHRKDGRERGNDNEGISWYGVNSNDRSIQDMFSLGVIEPCLVKEQIIKTAVEVSTMLVRVDDVFVAKQAMQTHTHADGTKHSHERGNKAHDHFDKLGKLQRPSHHYY